MNKMGIGGTPLAGDQVVVYSGENSWARGTVINWGVEAWGQHWVTLKTHTDHHTQINIAQIQNYTIEKRAQTGYELVTTTEEDGKVVKNARSVKPQGPHTKHTIKRGLAHRKENIISRSIATPDKGVEEPTVASPKLEGDPITQAQTLAELYNQKRKMAQEDVSDHMKREDLVEVEENYALPSFKKRPSTET